MNTIRCLGVLITCCGFFACGPQISVSAVKFYPANPNNCPLEFVQAEMSQMAPGGKWELVGYVILQQEGVQNPLSDEYRKIVSPRACAMGGEAVAIMQATTTTNGLGSGSGIIYGVLRKPGGSDTTPFNAPENDTTL